MAIANGYTKNGNDDEKEDVEVGVIDKTGCELNRYLLNVLNELMNGG